MRARYDSMGQTTLVMTLAALLFLGACSPHSRLDVSPDPRALDPFFQSRPGELGTVHTFRGVDDAELGFVSYRSINPKADEALVYLHGIESHAGWFDLAARQLSGRGYDVFCLDRRGSGINRENRGFISGHTDSFETLLADVRHFNVPARSHYTRLHLMGLSWGGKQALAYGLTYPQDCDSLILITPGLRALVDMDGGTKLSILFASSLDATRQYRLPIEAEMFTTTPRHLKFIKKDPLRLKTASARFLMQSSALDGYVDGRISKNNLPILLFLAGQDRIIDNRGVLAVLERGNQDVLDVRMYTDQTHSIQFDAPARMAEDIDAWLKSRRDRDEDSSS